jgi:ketosteroid isomerase-like protein
VLAFKELVVIWGRGITSRLSPVSELAIVHAEPAGDGVVEIGRADLTVADGQVVTVKYVVHWKQEDGGWKWNVDIWNPNQ